MSRKQVNRYTSCFMAIVLLFNLLAAGLAGAEVSDLGNETVLKNQTIAKGIQYTEKQLDQFLGTNLKERINVVTADLNEEGVNIITSKAKDKILKMETLSQQIEREQFKGQNVVAGINADMFNMSTGMNIGAQVKDGNLIVGFNSDTDERIFPMFGIDADKKPFIDNVSLDGMFTVVDSVYEEVYGVPNPEYTMELDTLNRESNLTNRSILYTLEYNQDRVLSGSMFNASGALTVIKGVSGPLKLGQEYEGVVESIGAGATSGSIPYDGVVLATNGTKTEWLKSHVKPGDKVRFKFTLDKPNVVEATAGYTWLVKDNQALTRDQMLANGASASLIDGQDKARTAIGITEDNKVIAVTLNGGQPSIGISNGATLTQMAAIMKSLGAVKALSLDGGGSTQMNVRLFGESKVGVVNKPSDGNERAITNGILFVSNSSKTGEIGSISVEKDIVIYKNTPFQFTARGADSELHPINLSNAEVNWSADEQIGTVNEQGLFVSGSQAGKGLVTARVGEVRGSAQVTVVDQVYSLALAEQGTVTLEPGSSKRFELIAKTEDGRPIVIDNSAVQWKATGGIGLIDQNGVLTAVSGKANGTVTAELGSHQLSVNIVVGQDALILDDFEHQDGARYKIDGYVGGVGSVSSEQAKSGSYSYKISYDYAKWNPRPYNGTINFRPTFKDKDGNDISSQYRANILPKKLGMWIYGDGKSPWLRAIIKGGDGANRTVNLTGGTMNWIGWKYIDVDIPQDIPAPISLVYIYMVETNKSLNHKGAVYFDDIRFAYSENEDLKGPSFSNAAPSSSTIYTKDVELAATLSDDKTGVDPASIVAKLDGQAVTAVFDEQSGRLIYQAKDLTEGPHEFTVEAKDKAGNTANPPLKKTFTVNLQADTVKPQILNLIPLDGSTVKTPTPRISFKVTDVQSGVYVEDIAATLDGEKVFVYYDEPSGWAYAVPNSPLADGSHTIVLNAKDRAGNVADQKQATFNVVSIPGPRNPEKFVFSNTSDTHATAFGYQMMQRVNDDESELVIQNGDIVDTDTAAQWNTAKAQLALIKNKPVMMAPGNHEVMNGTITNYVYNFGMPAYSFEYGNSKFIMLNTAFGQSISGSDPTQFHYLQKMLNENTKTNVFVIMHVPTKDTFGTAHEMLPSDAAKLEKILSDYKKANPAKSVQAIFGHLHVSQSWEIDGVMYTISGDGALKKYVTPDKGGFLSYTKFYIDGNKVEHRYTPLVERINVMDEAIDKGKLKIVQGASRSLNVYGDFTTLTADYVINLSVFRNLDITYTSDRPEVISVTPDGVITAHQTGEANITVTVSGKTTTIKVVSVDPKSVAPIKIGLMETPSDIDGGDSVQFFLTAFDAYGNKFALDNKVAQWQVTNNVGTITADGIFTAARIGKDTPGQVIATYKGFKATAPINVLYKARLELSGPQQVYAGGTMNVAVDLKDLQDLYGASVTLSYDPGKLELLSSTVSSWLDGQVIKNEADPQSGTVSIAVTKLGEVSGNMGEGNLAILSFRVKESAQGQITVTPVESKVQLATSQNQEIPVKMFAFTKDVTPASSVKGTVTLPTAHANVLSDKSGYNVTLVSGEGVNFTTQTLADGSYTLPLVPYGKYTLAITAPGYKKISKIVEVTAAETVIGTETFYVGDFNNDGFINIIDLSGLAHAYDKAAEGAAQIFDANRNGKIDLNDVVAVARNFGK